MIAKQNIYKLLAYSHRGYVIAKEQFLLIGTTKSLLNLENLDEYYFGSSMLLSSSKSPSWEQAFQTMRALGEAEERGFRYT